MINMKMKKMFFDRQAVISKTDKATRKVLSKFGAFVRTSAKQSIKKAPFFAKKKRGVDRTDFRKRVSKPGQPPYSRSGKLKKFIFFGYDTSRRSVVIGPERLTGWNKGKAPALLEYGGSTVSYLRKQKRTVSIAARPYMGPAFEKEREKLPSLWRNSIR